MLLQRSIFCFPERRKLAFRLFGKEKMEARSAQHFCLNPPQKGSPLQAVIPIF